MKNENYFLVRDVGFKIFVLIAFVIVLILAIAML